MVAIYFRGAYVVTLPNAFVAFVVACERFTARQLHDEVTLCAEA